MDGHRFDHLARLLVASGTRRGLVGSLHLLTLPGIAGLLALADGTQDAAGRRRKNKRKRKAKHKKKRCRPQPLAETCAETCGTVKNNCQQSVDCGSCDCGACPICQTCDAASGDCVADAGDPPCGEGRRCCGGVCCAPAQVCADYETCCTPRTEADVCAAAQASGRCGAISDGCGGSYDCACPNGVCQTCSAQGTCEPADGPCDNGNPCTILDTCDDGVCTPGTAAPDGKPCGDGGVCCTGRCAGCCGEGTTCGASDTRCCGGTCDLCRLNSTVCGPGWGVPLPECACGCCSGRGREYNLGRQLCDFSAPGESCRAQSDCREGTCVDNTCRL